MNDAVDDATASRVAAPRDDSGRCFERDVMPLAGDLHRFALGYARNTADAEDLVQETLLRAFKAFDGLHDGPHIRNWLLVIMRNTWISNHRARTCRPTESLVAGFSDHGVGSARGESEETRSAEHQALRDVMNADVLQAVLALPYEMRETLYFIAIEGMKSREVAELMGISLGTVASRMHRCRNRLRRSLGLRTTADDWPESPKSDAA
jgi:RNA polymerase sigma-70 factor, ECF subfamily